MYINRVYYIIFIYKKKNFNHFYLKAKYMLGISQSCSTTAKNYPARLTVFLASCGNCRLQFLDSLFLLRFCATRETFPVSVLLNAWRAHHGRGHLRFYMAYDPNRRLCQALFENLIKNCC